MNPDQEGATPTPLTDAARIDNADLYDWGTGKSELVRADFARSLERQLARLTELAKANAPAGAERPCIHCGSVNRTDVPVCDRCGKNRFHKKTNRPTP